MKKTVVTTVIVAGTLLASFSASAQYKADAVTEKAPKTEVQTILEEAEAAETPVTITLEQALEIALSENVSVKVADMEIERTGYAKKGAYSALYPNISANGSYQRTLKRHANVTSFNEFYDIVFITFVFQGEFVVECELCFSVVVKFEFDFFANLCSSA